MSLFTTHEDIAKVIEEWKPDVVGTTAITATEPDSRVICETAKRWNPAVKTVIGNVHATFCWDQILRDDPNVDFVVRGEGEATIAELVRALAAGGSAADLAKVDGLAWRKDGVPTTNAPRALMPDLDVARAGLGPRRLAALLVPAEPRRPPRDRLLGARLQPALLLLLAAEVLGAHLARARSPEGSSPSSSTCATRYGVRVAMLSDETPTSSRPRWEQILDLLVERQTGVEILMETRVDDVLRDEDLLPKYRAAGVSHVYLGVESVSQSTLDLYQKDIKVAESKKAIDLINAHEMVSETSLRARHAGGDRRVHPQDGRAREVVRARHGVLPRPDAVAVRRHLAAARLARRDARLPPLQPRRAGHEAGQHDDGGAALASSTAPPATSSTTSSRTSRSSRPRSARSWCAC